MSDNQLFKPEIRSQLQTVLSGLNREQLLWLGGYISAAIDFAPTATEPLAKVTEEPKSLIQTNAAFSANESKSLTILYGSHSGNSQKIATLAHNQAEHRGIKSRIINMEDYNGRFLKDEEQILLVVSTHGEGEPPLAALDFYELLSGNKAPKLPNIPFSVIALGDSSYSEFCKTGYDFHNFLTKLGGVPISEVKTLDTDFANHLHTLIPEIVRLYEGNTTSTNKEAKKESNAVINTTNFSDSPAEAPILNKIQLNGRGSEKETWHLEISTDKTGLTYQPGDSLEVFANNSPKLVEAILETLSISADTLVEFNNKKTPIFDVLTNSFELTLVTSQVLKKYASLLPNSSINQLLDDAVKLEEFLHGTDVLDLLTNYPTKITAEELITILRPLPSRLYSISSSPEEVGTEVHITVGAVRYEKENRNREGVCSTFIADRLKEDGELKVKIKPNNQFRLPTNGDIPIIMIGAGTGIAPYRAFIQHRNAKGEKGKNWLIYGDRNFTSDFLYQTEWLKYKKSGLLTNLHVAFSRDQEEKIYVQHRLKENGKEIYKWITGGAHFYICGDMKKMARDVKATLLDIFQIEGNLNKEESEAYLQKLRKEGRYQEDVY